MSLIKTVVVLSVAVMLLPTDERRQADIVAAAGTTLTNALTFCERNREPCAKASEGWAVFVRKAEFGFDLAGRMIREGMAARTAAREPVAAPVPAAHKRIEPEQPRGTLTREDVAPEWRAPVRRTSY